jgi:hypothetical protein
VQYRAEELSILTAGSQPILFCSSVALLRQREENSPDASRSCPRVRRRPVLWISCRALRCASGFCSFIGGTYVLSLSRCCLRNFATLGATTI